MPKQYPESVKRQAIDLLQLHNDITIARHATGVDRRTLRRWRSELRKNQDGFMSEKTSPSDTKTTKGPNPPEITPSNPQTQKAQIRPKSPTSNPQTHPASTQEADPPANSDYDDFVYIRAQLMKHARHLARDLGPDKPDSNRRSLALARILDRIQQLDEVIPVLAKQLERPAWQDARDALLALDVSPTEIIKADQAACQVDDSLKARVYTYYAELYEEQHKSAARWKSTYSLL